MNNITSPLLNQFFLVMLLMVFNQPSFGQPTADFQDKVEDWIAENNVPAIGIGIIENGQITYEKVIGELRSGIPAPINTIFNIASITKPVVAVMTLQLVESKQWSLDEPLAKYWIDPDVADDPRHEKLTTRHVLTHQTGFSNWRSDHPSGKLTFDFEPGRDYNYSGEGFEYLRKALEGKFGRSIQDLADSLLFSPLGMTSTRFSWEERLGISRLAYLHNSEGAVHHPSTPEAAGVNAAASLLTTVGDFCKFMQYVLKGAGLSPDIYKDMITLHVPIKEYYGKSMGWEVITGLPDGEIAIEHSGSNPGAQSIAIMLPQSKRGLVLLTNGDNGILVNFKVIKEVLDIGNNILTHMTGTEERKAIILPIEVLKKHEGVYLDETGTIYNVVKKGELLEVSGDGVPTVQLYPESETLFFLKDFDVQFNFPTDSMHIVVNGKIDSKAVKVAQEAVIEVSEDILEMYVGAYVRSDDNSMLNAGIEDGVLVLTGSNIPKLILQPTAENQFFAEKFPYQFEFVTGNSAGLPKVNIMENGTVIIVGTKQP